MHCGLTNSIPKKDMDRVAVNILIEGGQARRSEPMMLIVTAWYQMMENDETHIWVA